MPEDLQLKFEAIADGLATTGLAAVDHFLSPDEVMAITLTDEFQTGLLRFKKAGIGKDGTKQINEAVRGDHIQWLDRQSAPEPVKLYLDRLTALQGFLNQSLFLSLKDFEVHMTIYPVGTFYKRHLDQFKKDDHRKLSVIVYLNDSWTEEDGGQLRVFFPDTTKDFFPLAGRLICFRSDLLEHEVLAAKRDRMSITGWLVDRVV